MVKDNFDLIVVGAGPGGIEAALYASRRDLSVALVSATKIGGRATWGSLIPSKVWLASAEKAQSLKTTDDFAFQPMDYLPKLDLELLRKKVGEQSGRASENYSQKLRDAGITTFFGTATLQGKQTVKVSLNEGSGISLSARNIILASGSGPRFTPDIKPNKDHIIAPKIAPGVARIPESMVMAGGGVTGTEYAYAFASLGTKVTIIQTGDQLLPRLDNEVSQLFEEYLTTNLPIQIITNAKVVKMEQQGLQVITSTQYNQPIKSQYGFIAIGRKADLSFLAPDGIKLELSPDQTIKIDQFGQTSQESVYAIGDVTGTPMTANRATMQARVAVEHILAGKETTLYPGFFIEAVYTNPAVAQIGNMDEDENAYTVTRHFNELLKTNIRSNTAGLLKLKISKKSGLILGASGFGVNMPDLMAVVQIAMNNNLTYSDLKTMPMAYPSVSELITNLD
jgi:pyruvate/2-oxoglutarate dehydrogenase complex dihydrolipoamide dehydrogenase (E3) component